MGLPFLLLVDDAPELGDIVTYLGKRTGFEVGVCPDVPSAWAMLQGRRPDLLLVDVNLPGVSGLELCRRVRATPFLADLTMALFSHWGLPGDVAAGLESGAEYVVSKELVSDPVAWQQRLEEILRARDSQGAPKDVALTGTAAIPVRADWPDALNQVLRARAFRLVGAEVLRVVVRRALAQGKVLTDAEAGKWITSDGFIKPGPDFHSALDGCAASVVLCLAEQMERLLGGEASRPVREGLAKTVPGLPGLPAH